MSEPRRALIRAMRWRHRRVYAVWYEKEGVPFFPRPGLEPPSFAPESEWVTVIRTVNPTGPFPRRRVRRMAGK